MEWPQPGGRTHSLCATARWCQRLEQDHDLAVRGGGECRQARSMPRLGAIPAASVSPIVRLGCTAPASLPSTQYGFATRKQYVSEKIYYRFSSALAMIRSASRPPFNAYSRLILLHKSTTAERFSSGNSAIDFAWHVRSRPAVISADNSR